MLLQPVSSRNAGQAERRHVLLQEGKFGKHSELLAAKRLKRIGVRGAASGNVGRYRCDDEDKRERCGDCDEIDWAYAIQQAGHQTAEPDSSGETCRTANENDAA